MFERFTDRARRVVVLAGEEARLLGHTEITTGHVLVALLHEGEGVGSKALTKLGVSIDDLRGRVVDKISEGEPAGPGPSTGHLPFTPRCKRVMELSLREALQLGHNYIGTEHILLGIVREGTGDGAVILVESGVDLADARRAVIDILSGYERREPPFTIELTSAAGKQLAAWLEGIEGVFGPFDESHPARQLRVAIIDAQRKGAA